MGDEEDDNAIEAQLVARIASGDRVAEAVLFRRVQPRVRAWATLRVRERSQAADLTQHVMVATLEALRAGRVHAADRLGAFLHGTCKNTLMAWRRGERRRTEILDAFGPTLSDVATINDTALDRRRVAECFERLVPRAKSILALTFFADRSAREIASELATTTANVRVLRHRAIHQLHDCVTGDPS